MNIKMSSICFPFAWHHKQQQHQQQQQQQQKHIFIFVYSHFIWHHRDSFHSQKKITDTWEEATKTCYFYSMEDLSYQKICISLDCKFFLESLLVISPSLFCHNTTVWLYDIFHLYHDVDCLFIRSLYENFILLLLICSVTFFLYIMFCLMFLREKKVSKKRIKIKIKAI